MYTALLNQQRDHFKSFDNVFMDATNLRLDSLATKKINDIKANLWFMQKDIEDIKAFSSKQDECGNKWIKWKV